MLYRKIEKRIEESLKDYKEIPVVTGARQIGKTYIIRKVCEKSFKNFIEINLLDDFNGSKLFENINTTDKFYLQISALFGDKLDSRENTVVFLDEIQCYPHLITMLKFLKDENRFTYIASGSLLGVTLNECISVPIGYIKTIKMYPLDFEEFLIANNVGTDVINEMEDKFNKEESLSESLHKTIIDYLKKYLIVGGLPACVVSFLNDKNISKVRDIQTEIQNFYKIDAQQYDKERKLKIGRIYDLIPSYLENKKKRVIFKDINNTKKRYEDYLEEFDYLVHSGITLDVKAITNPVYPLLSSVKSNLLKLYYNDVGLITNNYFKKNINAIMDDKLSINLGSVYETFVCTELTAHNEEVYYYDNRTKGEVDYLLNDYKSLTILPIEVKSGKDYKIHNSLNKFLTNYNITKGIVLSNERLVEKNNNVLYLPIYFVMFLNNDYEEDIILN